MLGPNGVQSSIILENSRASGKGMSPGVASILNKYNNNIPMGQLNARQLIEYTSRMRKAAIMRRLGKFALSARKTRLLQLKEEKESWFDRWIGDEHPDIRARASNIVAASSADAKKRNLAATSGENHDRLKDGAYDPHKAYSVGAGDSGVQGGTLASGKGFDQKKSWLSSKYTHNKAQQSSARHSNVTSHMRRLYAEEKNHFFSFWDRARAFELYHVDDTRRLAAAATFKGTVYDSRGTGLSGAALGLDEVDHVKPMLYAEARKRGLQDAA
jgi:hypothetical protein